MPRRVSLPGADELFRATAAVAPRADAGSAGPTAAEPTPPPSAPPEPAARQAAPPEGTAPDRRGTGRVRHNEKMTVYISADELLELEHARLVLRRELGGAVDRGRVVREAVAIALADLVERGADSDLVRRLTAS